MSSVDSSAFMPSMRLTTDVGDRDRSALRLIVTYLNMMAGPLWKRIRGLGLAYDFYNFFDATQGLVRFYAIRVSEVIQVYDELIKFVDSLASDQGENVDEFTLEVHSTFFRAVIHHQVHPSS